MTKTILIIVCCLFSLQSFTQSNEEIKYRKLEYKDFKKLSINDTSDAVVDLFFNKTDNAIYTQIILLPISVVLTIIPPTHFVGIGSLAISGPLFINGSATLIRYRKKKLYSILLDYKEKRTLPKWARKKANRRLKNYELLPINY
jgi:hypothetical protein